MDRYEYKVRVAQIKSLIANKDFYEAMNIADTIDWRRVRSVSMLCTVSEIYKINRRYDDAKGILLMAYNRFPDGRTIVYALCELSIKLGEIPEAVKYLKEYMRLAKGDSGIYILQYKLYKSQGVSPGECIDVLNKLKSAEYQERWAFELAYQYHLDGQVTKCIEECDEMILWFGRGKYVTKALELKMQHTDLTEDQQRKYDRRNEPERPLEDIIREQEEEEMDKLEQNVLQFTPRPASAAEENENTEALSAEYPQAPVATENAEIQELPEAAEVQETITAEAESESDAETEVKNDNPISIEIKQIDPSNEPTKRIPFKEIEARIEAEDINVPPFNMAKYSTLNLQAEIKKNLAEFAQKTGQPIRHIEEPIEAVGEVDEPTDELYTAPIETIEEIEEIPADAELPAETASFSMDLSEENEEELTEMPVEETEDETAAEVEEPVEESIEEAIEETVEEEEEAELEEPPLSRPYTIVVHGAAAEAEDSAEEDDYPEETIGEADKPLEIKVSDKIREGKPKKYAAPKPREVEGFSDAEKEIFADFLPMHDLPDLIKSALSNIQMTGTKGNVILTGNEQSARIKLAGALANDLRLNNPDFVGKIAKISASTFNTKDAVKAIKALDGGALVIERAGDLSEDTLNDIHEILTHQDTSIVLFFEDARLSMRRLESNHEWIREFFDVKINIPTYTNDDLVFHGREYAREQEYSIDDMGVLALYTRIDEMQTADHAVTINEVEKIVDEAIRHAGRHTPSHLIDLIIGKRYDDDDLIVLREKDFI